MNQSQKMMDELEEVEGRPPKGQIDKLVQAFGRKLLAEDPRTAARLKDQERVSARFFTLLATMKKKYPNVDMTSDSFFSALETKAKAWLKTRTTKGAGIDF